MDLRATSRRARDERQAFMTELALLLCLAVPGLAFAAIVARWVLARSPGDGELVAASARVREIAERFHRRSSRTIAAVSAVVGGVIFLAYGLLRRANDTEPLPALELGAWLTISFGLGVASSLATARLSVWIATRASVRVASAARRSVDEALRIAIRAGAVPSVVGSVLSFAGLGALFAALVASKGGFGVDPRAGLELAPSAPLVVCGFALGASFSAFCDQLASGVFAKAADVGADLGARAVGMGEDDPRNPAAWVDLAGDIVAGAAASATSMYQAAVAESLAAMMAAAAVFRDNRSMPSAIALILFPLVARAFGLVASIFGVMVVRTDEREDPSSAIARGLYVTATLHAVGMAGAAKWLLGDAWATLFACALVGVALGVALFHVASWATDHRARPVRDLAEAARGGPTFATLHGLGMIGEAALAPLALVAVAGFTAYALGARIGLEGGGAFGLAIAVLGLVGSSGHVLALGALGAVTDGASGLVEMTIARDRPDVRGRAGVLDAVGNSIKATVKTFGAAAAALSAPLLARVFVREIGRRAHLAGLMVDLERPALLAGVLLGAMLVLWVAARVALTVARTARRVLDEVRRQSRGAPQGFVADSEATIEIASRAALREMLLPAFVGVVAPVAFGLLLRLAPLGDNALVLADAVAAFVLAATITGVLGLLLFGNAGAAWDNAKKYIATGAHGGRYLSDEAGARVENPTYAAALVGDAIGDPLKDAVAPALHVLVKMTPVVALVFLPFFL